MSDAAPDSIFTPSMLEHGIYYGAYVAGTLVAAAGTHAISRHHRIAAIGNVFTHPTHQGRGLATATTGAVAQAIVQDGAREVALNVAADNRSRPATRAARLREVRARSGRW